jgi:hypothetical protein
MCLEAVKQDGNSLKYVKEQTEEICLEAVKQNGYAIKYVNINIFTQVRTIQIDNKVIEISEESYQSFKAQFN